MNAGGTPPGSTGASGAADTKAVTGITAVVLAGGQGRRMSADGQGRDKALAPLDGRPLIAHVLERLRPQVARILINANGDAARFAGFGLHVVPDAIPGHAGPLAGLHAAMTAADTDWVLTVPCDVPALPHDLVARLVATADAAQAELAVACTGGRPQPVFMLARRALADDLAAFLARGDRKVELWYRSRRHAQADFPDPAAFANLNTMDDLDAAERTAARARFARAIAALPAYDPQSLPVAQAQQLIRTLAAPVARTESVPVRDAVGRVLAHDLLSPIDVPAHDNAAMDGFALRGADLLEGAPTRLRIVGRALAGRPWDGTAASGEAVRVMTGAVMPAGLNTVVMHEICTVEAQGDDTFVQVPPGQTPGQNRRSPRRGPGRGPDLPAGRPRVLEAADAGLIASLGIDRVEVRRRLRVAYFSTGDEVRAPGQPLGPGQIYDSNGVTIGALLARLGVEPIDLGIVGDDPAALEHTLRDAATRADAIVSSGGVSTGEADHTRTLMATLGDVTFWGVAMRPGRPLAVGQVGGATYFGLPGNPVAAMIAFLFFAREGLLAMAGAAPRPLPMFRVRSAETLRKRPGRTEFQRGVLRTGEDGRPKVALTGSQGSGVLRSMAEADCILVLGHDEGTVQAGDDVTVLPLRGLI